MSGLVLLVSSSLEQLRHPGSPKSRQLDVPIVSSSSLVLPALTGFPAELARLHGLDLPKQSRAKGRKAR